MKKFKKRKKSSSEKFKGATSPLPSKKPKRARERALRPPWGVRPSLRLKEEGEEVQEEEELEEGEQEQQ